MTSWCFVTFFFSSRRRHTRWPRDWSSDVCSSDLTFAITVRHRDATRYSLRRISDLTRVAPRWKAGFGYEFLERADGFRGLASVYGLRFASPPTAMDLGLTYRDRKSTRLNSSHVAISYAVFCLKK